MFRRSHISNWRDILSGALKVLSLLNQVDRWCVMSAADSTCTAQQVGDMAALSPKSTECMQGCIIWLSGSAKRWACLLKHHLLRHQRHPRHRLHLKHLHLRHHHLLRHQRHLRHHHLKLQLRQVCKVTLLQYSTAENSATHDTLWRYLALKSPKLWKRRRVWSYWN